MTVLFTFSVKASETILAKTFDQLDDVQFEMEHAVTMPSDHQWPCLWITGHSREEIERTFRDEPDISEFDHITSENDRFLYHLSAPGGTMEFRDIIQEENGTILAVTGEEGEWKLQVRCRDKDHLARVHDRLSDEGIPPEIHQIRRIGDESDGTTLLTEQQRQAFEVALEHGYFDIPRKASLEDIAAEMGISYQAVSERLRRGYESLVEEEIGEQPEW